MREAEERRAEGELAHLSRDGVHDVLPTVAAVDVPQGGQAIDERPALGIVQVDALAADEDAGPVLGVLLEGRRRVEEVSAVERGESIDLLVAEGQTRRHGASSRRYDSMGRRPRIAAVPKAVPPAKGRRPQAKGRRPQAKGRRPQAEGRRPQAEGRREDVMPHDQPSRAGHAQTVLGLVAPEALGLTLPHEHLFVDLRFLYRDPSPGSAAVAGWSRSSSATSTRSTTTGSRTSRT